MSYEFQRRGISVVWGLGVYRSLNMEALDMSLPVGAGLAFQSSQRVFHQMMIFDVPTLGI